MRPNSSSTSTPAVLLFPARYRAYTPSSTHADFQALNAR